MQKCWSHANIPRWRKIELYAAIVLPKLLYNLESVWLLQADKRRLDGFHARCLRQILSIPSAYVSRISNKEVLEKANQLPLSSILLDRQKAFYVKTAALPGDSFLRMLTCQPESNAPRRWAANRKRGRPKQQWADCVSKLLNDRCLLASSPLPSSPPSFGSAQ